MDKFLCEGKSDVCLLVNVGTPADKIEPAGGRGAVCRILAANTNYFGLIDEDPSADHHPYFKTLRKKAIGEKYGIITCTDEVRSNKLVALKPNLHEWIIKVTIEHGISISDYGLSNHPITLHREINFRLTNFQSLLHFLKRDKNPHILHLMQLVK